MRRRDFLLTTFLGALIPNTNTQAYVDGVTDNPSTWAEAKKMPSWDICVVCHKRILWGDWVYPPGSGSLDTPSEAHKECATCRNCRNFCTWPIVTEDDELITTCWKKHTGTPGYLMWKDQERVSPNDLCNCGQFATRDSHRDGKEVKECSTCIDYLSPSQRCLRPWFTRRQRKPVHKLPTNSCKGWTQRIAPTHIPQELDCVCVGCHKETV